MNKNIVSLILSLFLIVLAGCSAESVVSVENKNEEVQLLLGNSVTEEELITESGDDQPDEVTEVVEEVREVEVFVDKEMERPSNEEIATAALKGAYGNGADRKANIESMGYDYEEIQKIVNQMTPKKVVSVAPVKPSPEVVQLPVGNTPPPTPTEVVSEPKYRANRVYMLGSSMPIKISNNANAQEDIDSTKRTWVTAGTRPNWSPYDNYGTFFSQHNHSGGDIIMKLNYGDIITVTDSNGKPYKYVVDKIVRNNMETRFTKELAGALNKEYLIFQTCEYDNGNTHVFATLKTE